MPHERDIKDERREITLITFNFDGSRHETWDAAFTPATPLDLQYSRADTDYHISHNTQHK
jgi:hypothetical protein